MDGDEVTVDVEKLKAIIADRGTSAQRVAMEAGLGPTAVRAILSGHVASPRMKTLQSIARVLAVTVSDLMTSHDKNGLDSIFGSGNVGMKHNSQSVSPGVSVNLTPVVGIVEAGVWREIDDVTNNGGAWDMVPIPASGQFGPGRQVAFLVRGDSMDQAGLPEGSYAVGIDWINGGFEMQDGITVVVERLQGQTREWTVKVLRLFEDRYELHPASSNVRWKPIVVPKSENDDQEVRILAKIMGAYTPVGVRAR